MATQQAAQKLSSTARTNLNFNYHGLSTYAARSPPANETNIERHKKTLLISFAQHLNVNEIEKIVSHYKRSIVTDESVLADLFNGDIRRHNIVKDDNYYRALKFTTDAFRPPQPCRPVHLMDIYDRYPFNDNVSAETPFVSDPYFKSLMPDKTLRMSFRNMKHIIFSFVRRWIHEIKENTIPPRSSHTSNTQRHIYPMLLHSKTALIETNDPNKMRTIWGASKIMILSQIMIYWSYFAYIKKHRSSTPLLWGYETLTGGWLRLNAELFHNHMQHSFVMIDWKRFDKYAEFSALRDLFRERRSFFTFTEGYEPTYNYATTKHPNPSFQERRLNNLWHWILEYYFHADLILPDGRKYQRTHAGIPSGVYTTQLDDSQYNTLMLSTIFFSLGVNFDNLKILGDDSLARLLTCIPPNMHEQFLLSLQEKADYYFGSIISIDKSRLQNGIQHCEVLAYSNNHGLPERDPLTALATFYHTKARSPSPSYTMSAAIGYAYALPQAPQRFYNALKDVHDYYASKGYTPDAKHLLKLGMFNEFESLPSTLTFPTRYETRRLLHVLDYTSKQMEKFWPTDYFIWDV
nr:MAG: putative RNA-dependent RNA polymerase [Alphapartitivirus sp.]